MAERVVTGVRRDGRDDITHLVGPWGEVDAATARAQLRGGTATYVVDVDGAGRVPVELLRGSTGDFLFASWDGTGLNNLDQLS